MIDQVSQRGDLFIAIYEKCPLIRMKAKESGRVSAILKNKKSTAVEINETFLYYDFYQSSNLELIAQFIIQSDNIDEESGDMVLKNLLGVREFTQDL